MSDIDIDRLIRATKDFMLMHGKDRKLADEALVLCEPVIRRFATLTWPLAPPAEVNPETAAEAIATALGVEVESVELVSLSEAFSPLRGESERQWAERADVMAADLQDSLDLFVEAAADQLESRFGGEYDELSKPLEAAVDDIFDEEPPEDFRPFGDQLPDCEDLSMLAMVPFCVAYTTLILAAAGETEMVRRAEPLLRLLPKAIPVGEYKDRPGHWLVAVA